MDQTTAINHSVLHGQRGGPVAQAALAIFAISLATLLGAWYFPIRARLSALPALPAAAHPILHRHSTVAGPRIGGTRRRIAPAYRCGLRRDPHRGSLRCRARYLSCGRRVAFLGRSDRLLRPAWRPHGGGSLLDQFKSVHVVRCDQAAWRFLGISLAGYNVLISLAMAAIAAYGLVRAQAAGLTAERRPRAAAKRCSPPCSTMPRCNALHRSINVPMTRSRRNPRFGA